LVRLARGRAEECLGERCGSPVEQWRGRVGLGPWGGQGRPPAPPGGGGPDRPRRGRLRGRPPAPRRPPPPPSCHLRHPARRDKLVSNRAPLLQTIVFKGLPLLVIVGCGSGAPIHDDAYVPLDAPAHAGPGPGGGLIDELRFAVVGDTRPANLDDTAGYPTAIVQQIFTDVEAESPHPTFAVTTGDYMFAATSGAAVGPQLDLYLSPPATSTRIL